MANTLKLNESAENFAAQICPGLDLPGEKHSREFQGEDRAKS